MRAEWYDTNWMILIFAKRLKEISKFQLGLWLFHTCGYQNLPYIYPNSHQMPSVWLREHGRILLHIKFPRGSYSDARTSSIFPDELPWSRYFVLDQNVNSMEHRLSPSLLQVLATVYIKKTMVYSASRSFGVPTMHAAHNRAMAIARLRWSRRHPICSCDFRL